MRLLQINSVANSGSTGRIAENIGIKAIENGWESYIAYGRGNNNSKSKLIKIGNDWDIKRHGLLTRLFDRHGLGSIIATKKLIEQIKYINPDIIHLHNIHGYYLNIEILFNYLNSIDIPIVWTLHDCWSFTGHCAHYDFIKCTKWKNFCNNCPQKKSYPKSFFFDRSAKNYILKKKTFNSISNLNIVTVSKWLKSQVELSFLQSKNIILINNGIDLNLFKPTIIRESSITEILQNNFILLGVASSWSIRKGLYDYLKLSKLLPNKYLIILIGLNKAQIKKLPHNIIGIERIDNITKLVELYTAANIVLNLSYEETFGMTTVEGYACGTPSIVYNATASPELIDNHTGKIVEKGNIEQVFSAIQEIKEKGKHFYSEACIDRANKFYNSEDRYNEYIDLYNKLIKS